MRTDYAYQDAIRRDFRNKATAVIAVGLLALVLTGAIEDRTFLFGGAATGSEAGARVSADSNGAAKR